MKIDYPHLYEITNERSAKNQKYFLNGIRAEYALLIFIAVNRGCTPESQKFPSAQLQSRHERIQVDELAVSLEGVMPV